MTKSTAVITPKSVRHVAHFPITSVPRQPRRTVARTSLVAKYHKVARKSSPSTPAQDDYVVFVDCFSTPSRQQQRAATLLTEECLSPSAQAKLRRTERIQVRLNFDNL